MPSSSRIVFAEDLGEASPWNPGPLAGGRPRGERRAALARRDAPAPGPTYEDGLRDGHAHGLETARRQLEDAHRAQAEADATRLDALFASLGAGLAELQQSLAADLIALAVEIARSAFGEALRVRQDAVEPAVRAALAALVGDQTTSVLHLHPDDLTRLGERLAPMLQARGVGIVPDPSLLPGGCRIETPRGSVDATVQTRWRHALAALGRDDDWVQP
jgi:flagellar assembly protein FliH